MKLQAEKMLLLLLYVSILSRMCKSKPVEIIQPKSYQAVKPGASVTITCHVNHGGKQRVWHKLTPGRRLLLLASTDILHNLTTFTECSEHYLVQSGTNIHHLTILTTTREDVGTYYCGTLTLNDVQFGQGTFLMIKGAKMTSDSVIQHPASQLVQTEDSVTLSCSFHADHCGAQHTHVLWFKHSNHSSPEIIYSSGSTHDACRNTDGGGTSCDYELLMRNLSLDDAGTFHCAVTACEQILFGNGTRIKILGDITLNKPLDLDPAVITLILLNIIFGLVILLLMWTLHKNLKKEASASS
ncbi:uncharacterized protein KZ484_004745 isoform 2-T2 [Pholidichthys leucotaenia]